MLKLAVILFLASSGGLISLILDEVDTGKEVFFAAAGIVFATVCLVWTYNLHHKTLNMIRDGNA